MSRTLTGILEWPQRAPSGEGGRVRQLAESSIIQSADDPMVPARFGQRFNLRSGLELTVEVGQPQQQGGGGGSGGSGGHGGGGGYGAMNRRRRGRRGGHYGGGPTGNGFGPGPVSS